MPLLESPTHRRMRSLGARRAKRRQSVLIAMGSLLAVLLVASAAAYAWRASSSAPKHGADTAPPRKDASTATSATVAETETPESVVPTIPVEPARVATISVTAVGDMIFDRKVKALVQSAGGLAPLRHVASILDGADITVGNLESPLSSGGTKNAAKDVTFRGDPRGIESLKAAGFDFLSLGNNHVLDYGPEALADTASALDTAGIGHAGAGADRTQAWLPAVREVNGASVAFLSFSHILPPGFTATDSKAGLAAGRNNMDAVTRAIAAAKADNDYVIVSYHWGVEYKDNANAEQVRDARASIDAGADMVLSHHPHVIQGIEFYEGGLIAYSTGDFLFDHYSRKTGEAFILQANLGPDGVTDVAATPVYLDSSGAPAVVTGNEATVILDRLKTISTPHGTSVTIASDIARLMP